jgi:trigger factor
MQTTVENLSPTKVKLSVNVPFAELAHGFEHAYAAIGKQVNIPGFRKGKVPASLIDQRVGRGAVLEEAVNHSVPELYEQACVESDLFPVGQPTIEITEIEDRDHITFTAEVEIRPAFDVPAYQDLKVEVDAVIVAGRDVEEQIDALRKRFATLANVERSARNGDLLLVDIKGEIDGEPVEDLAAQALSYELGTDGMLPGFDAAVLGASAGEERSFLFTPEAGEHEGKGILVTVTVQAVRERDLPELDNEFAMMASEFDTVEQLEADVRRRLERLKRLEQGYQARERVQNALLDAIDIPLPEGVLATEYAEHFNDGHGDAEHEAEFKASQARNLKAQFVFDKIAEAEQLQVNDQELSAWLVQQAPRYGMQPQQLADTLVQNGGVQMAIQDIRRAKALEVALKAAQVVDTKGQVVDLNALDEDVASLA